MDDIHIGPLSPSETAEAARVVGRAMGRTPFPMAIFRDTQRSERGMETSFSVMARRWTGGVLVARSGGRVVGVLRMVDWPNCQMTAAQAIGMLPVLAAMGTAALRGMRGQAVWGRHDPRRAHSHLGPLAVMPEMQGRGIGSRLLTRYCEIVDEGGGAAYLETDQPKNVRLYERFGFRTVAEAPALGVPSWFMWREAT